MSVISAVRPGWAVPGSRVDVDVANVPLPAHGPPAVRIGGQPAHVSAASRHRIGVIVPRTCEGGPTPVEIEGVPETSFLTVARTLTTGIHQVDSPVFDGLGRLYVTQSGGRGTRTPVSIYRVSRDGIREPVVAEVPNPTSIALGPDGALYVSSRFEGSIYRLTPDDRAEVYATDLGVPTGLAFSSDGTLFVGDRSGSILRLSRTKHVDTFATLPASVAAFHLAFGPDDALYVTAPTLASRDAVYRITPDRLVDLACEGVGRPQGLAFDATGRLLVADALAGAAGLYRVDVSGPMREPEIVLSAPALVGVVLDPDGGLVLASNDTVWRLDVDAKPYRPRSR